MKRLAAIFVLLAVPAGVARADLDAAKAQPNLEKRSKLAIDNAFAALKRAQGHYHEGDLAKTEAAIDEIRASVELARDSLHQTGKDPRRSPKWFKKAEIDTRSLGRRLEALAQSMSYADRPMLDRTRAVVQETHDELLNGLMEGRRK